MILPKEDKYYGTKETMREQIIHLLGGRVAEMLTLDDISTGASNDIQRATDIAKEMVTKYGFSDKLGPVNYSSSDEVFLGKDFSTRQSYSEGTAAEIDAEVKAIVEEAFEAAKTILSEHMEQLKAVAEGLLEVETLDHDQFVQLYDGERTPKELAEDLRVHLEKKKALNEEEAAEAEKLRKREASLAKKREMEEAAKALQNKEGTGKFKPRLMTYNEVSKTAEPFDPDKLAKDEEFDDEDIPETDNDADIRDWEDADDDMPSEEELAVYDTDYLNDDDEDEDKEIFEEDDAPCEEHDDEERK